MNTDLLARISQEPQVANLLAAARKNAAKTYRLSLIPALRPLVLAAAAQSVESPIFAVTATYREAEQLAENLGSLLGEDQVCYYPAWETLPHERLSPRSDTVGRRLEVLRRLAGKDEKPCPKLILAPVRAILQPQVPNLAQLAPVQIGVNQSWDLTNLAEALVAAAYTRVDLVERRGEFAIRGSIVDIFPPTLKYPVRIDFFGDEVEEIRYFSVADQRSLPETLSEFTALPCRELLLSPEIQKRAQELLTKPELPEAMRELLAKISQGIAVQGMESLAAALYPKLSLVLAELPKDSIVVSVDSQRVWDRSVELVTTSHEFLQAAWQASAAGGAAPIDLHAGAYQKLTKVEETARELGLSWWDFSAFGLAEEDRVSAQELPSWRGDTQAAFTAMEKAIAARFSVVLVGEGPGRVKRLAEIAKAAGLPTQILDTALDSALKPGVVSVCQANLTSGFNAPDIGILLVTANDLSGQRITKESRKIPTRRKAAIDPLELKSGDYVVHEENGVGRYREMVHREVAGTIREYLVIEYAPSIRGKRPDELFVPMDRLHLVTRYVGGEAPALDKLGGSDWKARKSKAKRAVRQIAAELIKLYAARRATQGYAFGPDTPWQQELEDAFNYVETPDQLAAIIDTKRDMERSYPMDRLICGDVGFGKTEIAVRAAFKAIMAGKQVAVLVPTTLLVTQHANTFLDRFTGFPIKVGQLSRFQTAKQAKEVAEGLASGAIDLVIGTHRLLSKDINFKDLGLVIIDEEQRFGVEHKEALKQFRVNVDVLSMSATPIPRTLEMAVTGIREMSVIQTPPEERHPVLTFAGVYDENQVRAAIRRELAREGQVFYIHNRTNTINKAAQKIADLVPEARVAVAHGQMSEKQLSQVMLDFWEKRADVLVCTTIVEAGLDISSANTLLIERADLLGLSQLHQLRGRVGRGRERGYAYFFYPPNKALTQTAHDRLATMAAHTDLGAGMSIAMKDLEIRGAGNLLGAEQSGHIADVGFDLYLRLVGEAIRDFDGEQAEPESEIKLEIPINAHLPQSYIESERLRLEIYKLLARANKAEDLLQIREELLDRYGDFPTPVALLLRVTALRLQMKAAGITELIAMGNNYRIAPVTLPDSKKLRLARLYPDAKYREGQGYLLFPKPITQKLGGQPLQDLELLNWLELLLQAIFEAQPLDFLR